MARIDTHRASNESAEAASLKRLSLEQLGDRAARIAAKRKGLDEVRDQKIIREMADEMRSIVAAEQELLVESPFFGEVVGEVLSKEADVADLQRAHQALSSKPIDLGELARDALQAKRHRQAGEREPLWRRLISAYSHIGDRLIKKLQEPGVLESILAKTHERYLKSVEQPDRTLAGTVQFREDDFKTRDGTIEQVHGLPVWYEVTGHGGDASQKTYTFLVEGKEPIEIQAATVREAAGKLEVRLYKEGERKLTSPADIKIQGLPSFTAGEEKQFQQAKRSFEKLHRYLRDLVQDVFGVELSDEQSFVRFFERFEEEQKGEAIEALKAVWDFTDADVQNILHVAQLVGQGMTAFSQAEVSPLKKREFIEAVGLSAVKEHFDTVETILKSIELKSQEGEIELASGKVIKYRPGPQGGTAFDIPRDILLARPGLRPGEDPNSPFTWSINAPLHTAIHHLDENMLLERIPDPGGVAQAHRDMIARMKGRQDMDIENVRAGDLIARWSMLKTLPIAIGGGLVFYFVVQTGGVGYFACVLPAKALGTMFGTAGAVGGSAATSMLVGNVRSRIHRWRERRKAAQINETRLWMEPKLHMQAPAYGKEAAVAGSITAMITAAFELFGVGTLVQAQVRKWVEYVCGMGDIPASPLRLEPLESDVHKRAIDEHLKANPLPGDDALRGRDPSEIGGREGPGVDVLREGIESREGGQEETNVLRAPSDDDIIRGDERDDLRKPQLRPSAPEILTPERLRIQALQTATNLFHMPVDAGGTWSAPERLFKQMGFEGDLLEWLTDAAKDFTERGNPHFRQGLLELMVPGQQGVTPNNIHAREIFLEHLFSRDMLDVWLQRISQAPASELPLFPDPTRGRMMDAIKRIAENAQLLLPRELR